MKMSSLNQVIISGIMLSLLFVLTPQAFAEKNYDKGYDKEDWEEKVNKMHHELGLSDDQREALKSHKEEHREDMKALREQLSVKREALREEMQKDDFDAGRVRMINDEIKRLTNEMADHRLEGILEVREILTPEQYSRFQEMKESRKDDWKERREDRGGKLREHFRDRFEDHERE
jgi:Spy/CpxP family protein refolding chaperone